MKFIEMKQKDLNILREKMFEEQNGKCKLCGEPLEERNHIDHQHMTKAETVGENGAGLVRGLICASCNTFEGKIWNGAKRFGKFNNKIEWLESLVEYYKSGSYQDKDSNFYIHPNEVPKENKKLKKSAYNKLKKIYTGKAKLPEYPKSSNITVKLKALFEEYKITDLYYK